MIRTKLNNIMRWVLILGLTLTTLISVLSFSATAEDDVNHVARVNGEDFTTLSDAFAVEGDITVELLKDVELSEMITIPSGKSVTLTGAHTITRGKLDNGSWYIATLLTISEGATLTLDGGAVIDGGNEWVFHLEEAKAAIEEYRNDTSKGYIISEFITLEDGAPQAKDDMITVEGSLILNNATIQNHAGTGENISAIDVDSTGDLTINAGASIRHNYTYGGAGTLKVKSGATVVMNGGEIAENYGGNRNGPNIDVEGGTFTMNGGKIHQNYGIKTNGVVMFLNDGGKLIMNGGEICENASIKGLNDKGWHCAIYVHNSSTIEMHGGKIWHNSDRISAIHLNNATSKFIFIGGEVIENDCQQSIYEVYSDVNTTYGSTVVSGGICTNDLGAYFEDGLGMAIDIQTKDGKEYVYYTPSKELVRLESNGKMYHSISAAMEDAVDGDTLTILCDQRTTADPADEQTVILNKNITLDLNGKTIYGWNPQTTLFQIEADVTITGNGTIDTEYFANGQAFEVGSADGSVAGSLTIENGTFISDKTIASVKNGNLEIKGGYYEATPYTDENGVDYERNYTLTVDDTAAEGSASIIVTGGTFYGFNPKNNISQGDNTNFVHEDYSAKNNSAENTWTVGLADFIARVESTGERYESLAEAVAAAGANGTDTVTLLKSIELCELVSLSEGNVTINADGYTITRGKLAGGEWYTGTLFSISAGASLTLDGGLIIDGGNNWTYKDTDGDGVTDLQSAVDNYTDFTGYNDLRFISPDPDAPIAQEDMFIVNGSLVFADLTIKNHYGIEDASVVQINNGGVLTMGDDTVLTHNVTPSYGTLVAMNSGSTFNMNGGIMSQNVSAHHGVCVIINGGTMTMNGGKVMHNHTCGGQGIFVRLNSGQLIINGGEVYENVAFPSEGNSSNKVGAVIDCTRSGKVTINDVYIHNNFGYLVGGVNHVGSEFVINGGKFLNNTAWAEFSAGHHLQDVSFGTPNGKVTGGIFTTEIYQACVNTADSGTIIPDNYEQFVLGTDSEGNPVLWGVFEGFTITFRDADGNVLQSGPVYKGELPVFNGAIPDGYFITWDKELAPATAEETYTLQFKLIVAEIIKADGTHGGYFDSLSGAINAAVSTDTVKLHRDIELTDKITVSDKEITIDGNSHTISRGKLENGNWYTGTLFSIEAGASLTLDGNLTIDGGNNWTLDEDFYYKALRENDDNNTVHYVLSDFVTAQSGAPVANSKVFAISGDLVINKTTIQNNYGSRIAEITSNASMTLNDGAWINHCVSTSETNGGLINAAENSNITINNGAKITDNSFQINGGIISSSGIITMNGGVISNNRGTNSNGVVMFLYYTAKFYMKGGEICSNSSLVGINNGRNSAVQLRNATMIMTGGTICHNEGYNYGGIDTNNQNSTLIISGGSVRDNINYKEADTKYSYWPKDDLKDIGGNVTTHPDGYNNPNYSFSGGIFSQDVNYWCPEGYCAVIIERDANGDPYLWEVIHAWNITFVDENGNALQSEPVRNGEMPVFNGTIASRDGYFWHWDADLVPATANATYQLVWKLKVAEVINSDGTHGGYYASLQEAIDAADSGETVRILIDTVELTEQVTVSGKNVTIDGNGKTITRGKLENGNWYTGTLFNVEAGAGLTLDGGLIIDGANAWTYTDTDGDGVTDLQDVFENYVHTSYGALKFVTPENGGAVANADMLTVSGSLTINSATIQNHYGTSGNRVIELTGGSLTVNDGALLTHNATSGSGTLVSMDSLSTFELNGGTISESVGYDDGGTINVGSGSMTMNGGVAENNHTTNGRGSFISISGGSFKMNGGTIQKNLAIGGNGSAINNMNGGTVTINGGSINNNYGSRVGGINSYNSMLYITGGQLVNNVTFLGYPSNDLAYSHNTNTTDKIHTEITGGIFTTDVYQGLVPYNEETAQAVTPKGYEEFKKGTTAGGKTLWEIASGWMITFTDEDGNVLQSEPVRDGEMPVFNGTIASRDGYVWSWDKTISPTTQNETYTLVWKLIVAEIIKADGTFGGYCTSLQNAIDAAESGDTVRILVNISLIDTVKVTGKDIILDGNGLTIFRGKLEDNSWFTGTLFSISSGAEITLDGNLTIDGGNNWTFKEAEYNEALEDAFYAGANGLTNTLYSGYVFIQRESGSYTNVASPMFDIAGNLIINNTTIKNQIGQVMTTNGGSVVLNSGTLITNNAYDGNALGGVAHIGGGTKFIINSGAEISNNYVGGNAGLFRVGGSVLTMNGGVIKGTRGVNSNGTVMMLYTGNATFIMNDGLICDNIGLPGPNNGHACAIYLHATGIMEMYGGTICHNTGRTVGGIIANSGSSKLTIYNGAIVNNIHTSLYTTDNTPSPYGHDVQRGNGTVKILGGVFTQDVNLWCGEEYIAVPQLYREIDGYGQHTVEVFDDRDAWLVGKTSIESDLQGDDRFGELRADGESVITVIANGSSFTAEYTIKHFYSKAYDMALTFDKELPVGTAIILQHTDENGTVRYWSYVVESATDTVLLDEFKLMGSADSYYADVELMRDVTLKVVVDFGAVAENARPEGTLSFDMELAPDTSFVSGAVLRESTEDVKFVTTEVGTSTQNSPSDQKFSYSVSFSDGNGQQVTDTDLFVYDDQYFALHVIIPDAPADAILTVNGNVYLPYKTGYYIIPLGNDFETDIQMTLSSDMFPATYVTYTSSCQLYVSNSTVATSPLNGIAIGSTLTGEFTIDGRASVDITCEDDKKVFTEEQDITVTVKSSISALYELAVVIEQKDENGNYVALNIAYAVSGDQYTFDLADLEFGSYRIVATVKDSASGALITQEFYYFLIG